jgi:hypothetical protein
MIIYSFDCAIKNLGFCCLQVNDNWRNDLKKHIAKVEAFYETSSETPLDTMQILLKEADTIVNSVLEIKYLNIFDFAAEGLTKDVKFSEVVKRLKYILFCLEKQLPKPDVVLIEYQMNANDKARGIARYIEEYFLPIGGTDATITYAIPSYPLIAADIPPELEKYTKIYMVTPNLKNAYQTDPSEKGDYQTYIVKYNRPYDANKAHSVHNFKYFLESRGLSHTVAQIHNKLDDIADAFMQAYSWCKHTDLF